MNIINDLEKLFIKHANQDIAEKQQAYMKNISPYLGLQKPTRAALQKSVFKNYKLSKEELTKTVKLLWNKKEREYSYAALDLLLSNKKLWSSDFINLFEELIENRPWWDTIDILASNCVGPLIKNNPDLVKFMDLWIKDENMWKRRVAILHQLKYKTDTDTERLDKYYKITMHEREFFIAKAIGWSLREYSKTNKSWVSEFINKYKDKLAPLSVREGSKYC